MRNNLSKVKNEAYVTNIFEYKSIESLRITCYVNGDNVTYFDSIGDDYIPKEIKKIKEVKISM